MGIPKLSEKPIRKNLTSRECAKLFGVTVSVLIMGGIEIKQVRTATRVLSHFLNNTTASLTGEEEINEVALKSLTAAASTLKDMAPHKHVAKAVTWWSKKSAPWERLKEEYLEPETES